jgi:hypothetical protein
MINKLINPKQFILGGKASFSLFSEKSQRHLEYYVEKKDEMFFVWSRGVCIGRIDNKLEYREKRILSTETPELFPAVLEWDKLREASKAFNWYWTRVLVDEWKEIEDIFYAYHHGLCAICKLKLKDPESVQRGIGPVCWGRIQKQTES